MSNRAALAQLAHRLRAASGFQPVAPVQGELGGIEDAYVIQSINRRQWIDGGRVMSGYKVAFTTEESQQIFGTSEPVYGTLFEDMRFDSGDTVPADRLARPKVEGEIVLELARDLPPESLSAEEIRGAVGAFYPALEIPDGCIAGKINALDMAADNAAAGGYVLGARQLLGADTDLAAIEMTMAHNGEVVSSGTGAGCMGDPLNVLAWLQGALARAGEPMRAGQIVFCGSLVPIIPAQPGDAFEATVPELPPVGCRFAAPAG